MPVLRCPNGKYRIGTGKCIYPDRATAQRAYRGYLYSESKGSRAAEVIRHSAKGG